MSLGPERNAMPLTRRPHASPRSSGSLLRACACIVPVLLAPAAQAVAPQTSGPLAERMPPERVRAALLPQGEWRPFPRAGEPGWEAVPEPARTAQVAAGAQRLDQAWEALPASLFLDYARSGNRERFQRASFARRDRLADLVLAEAIEDEGRFLDAIVDGLWTICEESWWGVPAHVAAQRAGNTLPDVEEPVVDLFAAETGALLSWSDYLLAERLDRVSPLVRRRIALEVERRILAPCRERDDFWWMGASGRRVNNWNPWIVSNWLACALLLERDEEQRAADVAKAVAVVDRFVAGYPADGGCDEGPGYWGRAAASLLDGLELLHSASGGALDAYDVPVVGEMGRFIARVCIDGEWFVNFADASARVRVDPALVLRFGRAIGDAELAAFGAQKAREQELGREALGGSLGRRLAALLSLQALARADATWSPPGTTWLPDLQVLVAREQPGSTRGFTLAAKGGHNDESHNHNDVGNFIVYLDGAPVLVDAGVGTYTAQTFSSRRYELWTMQSAFHNLPTVNGVQQGAGRRHAAREVRFEDQGERGVALQLELADAWPSGAWLESLRRRLALDRARGGVELTDTLRLSRAVGPTSWNLLTPLAVSTDEAGTLALADGGGNTVARVRFDPAALDPRVEPIALDDARLQRSWPDGLSRIVLSLRGVPTEAVVTLRVSR